MSARLPSFGPRREPRWQSLEEYGRVEGDESAPVRARDDEFGPGAPEWLASESGASRREFLKLAAASMALAGAAGCWRQPAEQIVPYVEQPVGDPPGTKLYFATALPLCGTARPVLVESHEGRPTKIEGNPDHPESLGAADAVTQAALYDLYDPDRSQAVVHLGDPGTWEAFATAFGSLLDTLRPRGGAGLRLLVEPLTSPFLAAQIDALLTLFPAAGWHRFDPVAADDAGREGARHFFGRPLDARYRLADADVILSLDADFLATGPSSLRLAREFAARRRAESGPSAMNRLYALESTPTVTGANADQRLALPPANIAAFARRLADALGAPESGGGPGVARPNALAGVRPAAAEERFFEALRRDLESRRGRAVVIAGPWADPELHRTAIAINAALGSIGHTVAYAEPCEPRPQRAPGDLATLVRDMQSGQVEVLVILGGNPAYTAPADIPFAAAMDRVRTRIHLASHEDETSALCHWHLPEAHPLESWSDAVTPDGGLSIIQPLVEPLYAGRTAHDLLALALGVTGRSGRELLQEHWRSRFPRPDFEAYWRRTLHDGFVAGFATGAGVETPVAAAPGNAAPAAAPPSAAETAGAPLQLVFRPDYATWDGRFANNAWLQEWPRPLTTLTWDNALLVSPADARELSIANGDVVDIAAGPRRLAAPAWVMPGQARGVVTLHLGYGRRRSGRAGSGAGVDAYALRTSDAPWTVPAVQVRRTGRTRALAATQGHYTMEGRDPVRVVPLATFRREPHAATLGREEPRRDETLYPAGAKAPYEWAMAIDIGACIGCGACILACQAENNIPVVGRDQVRRRRAMHWIRVDRYYEGEPDAPRARFQPVTCMHCENAPCEVVCPVAATVHSSEGLNQQIYNRCIGTRYCSNNCPYKVRRFNFLQYTDAHSPSLTMMRNPEVTVRSRGVMEKCTYCVQRIETTKIRAEKEDRKVRDGEIVPACAQTCPADAIAFGSIADPTSRVSKLRAHPLHYDLLGELNTRPRTTYLARVTNANPDVGHGGETPA